MRPVSKTSNTVYLEIDDKTCLVAGNDDTLKSKLWAWLQHGGEGNNKKLLLHTFESSGKHTIQVKGVQSGVGIDRILLLSASDTCVPSNKQEGKLAPGDNCASGAEVTLVDDTDVTESSEVEAPKPMKTNRTKIIAGSAAIVLIISTLIWVFRKKLMFWKP